MVLKRDKELKYDGETRSPTPQKANQLNNGFRTLWVVPNVSDDSSNSLCGSSCIFFSMCNGVRVYVGVL